MLAGLGGDEAVHTVDNDAQLRIIAVWTSPGAAASPPRTARLGGRDLWSYRLRRLHTHRFDEGLRSSRKTTVLPGKNHNFAEKSEPRL